MICSHCLNNENICYSDFGMGTPINLCWKCLNELGWEKEIKAILPSLQNCVKCKSKFIPKNKNQTKCSICWSEYFKDKEKEKKNIPLFEFKKEGGSQHEQQSKLFCC